MRDEVNKQALTHYIEGYQVISEHDRYTLCCDLISTMCNYGLKTAHKPNFLILRDSLKSQRYMSISFYTDDSEIDAHPSDPTLFSGCNF